MLKQLMQMQKQLKKTQKELEREEVTGASNNGEVEIVLTGTQKLQRVSIDANKIAGLNASDLEKLVSAALVDSLEKSKKLMAEKLGPLGGGMSGLKI